MSKATSEVSTSVKGTVREQLAFPVPEMPLSVPRPDLVKERGGAGSTLKDLFDLVVPVEELKKRCSRCSLSPRQYVDEKLDPSPRMFCGSLSVKL